MELLFVLCLLFARQANSENVHDKQEFEWNNTMSTMEKYFELTTPFYYNLTSTDDMMVNVTPEINLSPPVKRVLREIFRSYEPYCWRHSYGRGVGRPLHACPDHAPEQDGLLCYPLCRDGYNGVGPLCWQKCNNLTSVGFACMDVRTSLRSCPWYDKCGIFTRACSSCPANYTNFGCLCGHFYFRDSYSRGIGTPLVCSDSYEQDGALCYDKCNDKYNGVGPVCWQYCPITQPVPCLAGCSTTKQDCQQAIISMIQSVVGASITILNALIGMPLVDLTTFDILANAAKGDWVLVAKDMSNLAKKLTDKLLPDLAKKFLDWSFKTLESATRNASVAITATAFKDKRLLLPFLQRFRLDAINSAFNHGKCDLPDDFFD
ncbi:unnamed protein product [Rotaria magnacalcarata]|uniref:Uncharacterized protein n=3 Tax=Rotaria magnacalcarata TaxID=392030 RepID=A0A816V1F5_9BILA|nr:unnamed protein product [Rotaria magnacalcarata]CAF2115804.1 unnamed protein product [Rotaria magnacalcarata]CAF3735114.1 unnamed protein product [Rotaria magnacalcarata]CAF4346366.1 unnamed protein product [Rotaria magnacalcarata]CAF4757674.1 unnamed protein product [Rotaria magnacalcarata]